MDKYRDLNRPPPKDYWFLGFVGVCLIAGILAVLFQKPQEVIQVPPLDRDDLQMMITDLQTEIDILKDSILEVKWDRSQMRDARDACWEAQ